MLISAQKISKKWLQTSLTLEILQNESYVLSAGNGVGKTTLLMISAGLLAPDSGSISFFSTKGWSSSFKTGSFEQITGLENIQLFSKLKKVEINNQKLTLWRKEIEGFQEMLNTPVDKCSQGMKKVLNLYLSSISTPKLLIWDEPFASLSKKNLYYISNNWRELTQSSSLIISDHNSALPQSFIRVNL